LFAGVLVVNDFIQIQRDQSAATEAADLLAFIDTLRSAYERGTRIRAKMRHRFNDSGGANAIDWAPLQTLWGVPAGATSTGPTANGARVFTFIDGAIGSMEGTFQVSAAKDLTESVG
jgi:hypothetical protein